jgi:hypothetical protein
MLLVMVDHKEAHHQEPGQDAARNLGREVEIPQGARERGQEYHGQREDTPPAPKGVVAGEPTGCGYEGASGSDGVQTARILSQFGADVDLILNLGVAPEAGFILFSPSEFSSSHACSAQNILTVRIMSI